MSGERHRAPSVEVGSSPATPMAHSSVQYHLLVPGVAPLPDKDVTVTESQEDRGHDWKHLSLLRLKTESSRQEVITDRVQVPLSPRLPGPPGPHVLYHSPQCVSNEVAGECVYLLMFSSLFDFPPH